MLPTTESDFETDALGPWVEQRREVGRTRTTDVEGQMRQQILDQVGLMDAELVALAPSEERKTDQLATCSLLRVLADGGEEI